MNHQETESFIIAQLSRLTSHEDWVRTLTVCQQFHHYSFHNQILIAIQYPQASYVTGFHTWKKFGRSVNKGEKSIRILAPLVRKIPDTNDPDCVIPCIIGFRTVSVFDVAQTSGESFNPPTATVLNSQNHKPQLQALLAASPVPVTFVAPTILHGANGRYHLDTQCIEIRNDVAVDQQLKTLAHELAHHFGTYDSDTGLSRSWEECAAESTAFLACGLWGLDSQEYSAAYVASWADAKPEVIHQLTNTVAERLTAITSLLAPIAPSLDGVA